MSRARKHTAYTPIEAAYVAGVLCGRNIRKGCPSTLTGYREYMQTLTQRFQSSMGCNYVQARDSIKAAESEGLQSSWNAHGINSL